MQRELSVGDVVEIIGPSGITPKMFRTWCENGIVVPLEGGTGRGNHARFSVMQALGIAVAAKVYMSEHGCCPAYVGKVVSAFAAVSPEWLEGQFRDGKTHMACEHKGRPILQGKAYDWPDVQQTWGWVLGTIQRIEERMKERVGTRGRVRGLAAVSQDE
jgi:hypothetical protein